MKYQNTTALLLEAIKDNKRNEEMLRELAFEKMTLQQRGYIVGSGAMPIPQTRLEFYRNGGKSQTFTTNASGFNVKV